MRKRTEILLAGLGFATEESRKIVESGTIRLYHRDNIVLKFPVDSETLLHRPRRVSDGSGN